VEEESERIQLADFTRKTAVKMEVMEQKYTMQKRMHGSEVE